MCGGLRTISCRSAPGVSPVRTSVRIATSGRHAASSARRISSSGSARFFWTSFDKALSGDTYTTCVSAPRVPSRPWRSSVSIAERKAANVLPEPVGAAMRAFLPAAIRGQARRCGSVGSRKRDSNQRAMTGWKPDNDMMEIWRRFPEAATLPRQLLQRYSPGRRDALDSLADFVVRGRGARSDSHGHRSVGEPAFPALLGFAAHGTEPDGTRLGIDAGRVLDVVGRRLLVTDRREVCGVARVVPADHHHEVERLGDEFQHRVLTILGGGADRVERPEMIRERGLAVTTRHAPPDLSRDREGLPGEHRGLVRDPHADQVAINVESRGHLASKERNEPLPAPRSLDVRAKFPRLGHVSHDEVLSARILAHLAGGGLRLFVMELAVNHGREPVLCVGIDALPHVQHRATCGIHLYASDVAQPFEVLHLDTERG